MKEITSRTSEQSVQCKYVEARAFYHDTSSATTNHHTSGGRTFLASSQSQKVTVRFTPRMAVHQPSSDGTL